MDILEQLEAEVSEILARNRELLAAAKQARGLLADSEEKCSALKEENLMLRQSLDREKSLRQESASSRFRPKDSRDSFRPSCCGS